jgi:hypothetical protein
MRKMVDQNGTELEIVEHIILRNMWEYYVTTDVFQDDIVMCLVMGDFTELGDVSLDEIKPYVISRTRDLANVMPADGYRWVD